MIRIKDYIFNENEIRQITSHYDSKLEQSVLEVIFISNGYQIIYAHIEDIEWNYHSKEIEYLYKRNQVLEKNNTIFEDANFDLNRQIEEIEEENNKLKAEVDLLNDNRHFLNNKIGKSIKNIEELCKIAKEQDSDNVNLIDRLEIILKTLKGE